MLLIGLAVWFFKRREANWWLVLNLGRRCLDGVIALLSNTRGVFGATYLFFTKNMPLLTCGITDWLRLIG